MFGNAFSGWHLLLILAVILLLFGAAKLPALAKSIGQSARVFKGEIKDLKKDDEVAASTSTTPAAPTVAPRDVVPNESTLGTGGAPDTQR